MSTAIQHVDSTPYSSRFQFYGGNLVRGALGIAVFVLLIARPFLLVQRAHHFNYLADAFLHGSFAVDNLPAWMSDKVISNGHIFVPLGPLPGILLMPAVSLFGLDFEDYFASLTLTLLNVFLLNRILVQIGIEEVLRRRWLLVLFFLGTVCFSILSAGNSWFLSHILTMSLLFTVIYESLGKRRSWLIGLYFGGLLLTRATAVLSVVWVIYLMLAERRLNLRALGGLASGFAPALLFFLWYNYARFGSPFETGYVQAELFRPVLAEARSFGLFSPIHIPKNLYFFLIAPPIPYPDLNAPVLQPPYLMPSAWGMGILFTTPLFFLAWKAPLSDVRVRAAWLACICLAVPVLSYYGIGLAQFGYRYATDFYPFLFIPTALVLSRLFSPLIRIAILACVVMNLWGAVYSSIQLFRM